MVIFSWPALSIIPLAVLHHCWDAVNNNESNHTFRDPSHLGLFCPRFLLGIAAF